MPRTATATGYAYLDCPECRQGIAEPFFLGTGPVTFVHGHGSQRCRIWAYADEDLTGRIPGDMSLEEAGLVLRGRWKSGLPLQAERSVA